MKFDGSGRSFRVVLVSILDISIHYQVACPNQHLFSVFKPLFSVSKADAMVLFVVSEAAGLLAVKRSLQYNLRHVCRNLTSPWGFSKMPVANSLLL